MRSRRAAATSAGARLIPAMTRMKIDRAIRRRGVWNMGFEITHRGFPDKLKRFIAPATGFRQGVTPRGNADMVKRTKV